MGDAVLRRVEKSPLQHDRLRGRQMRLFTDHAVVVVDAREDRALRTHGLCKVRIQNALDEVRRGGLALRAGQTDHVQALPGVVVEQAARDRHRLADIRDDQRTDRRDLPAVLFSRQIVGRLRHVAVRAGDDGVRQKVRLEMGALAEEERFLGRLARVERHKTHGAVVRCIVRAERSFEDARLFKSVFVFFECVEFLHDQTFFSIVPVPSRQAVQSIKDSRDASSLLPWVS